MMLSTSLQAQILEHAKAESPSECCGLLAVVKGRLKYFECENLAYDPEITFLLNPNDYMRIEDKGEIVGVVHSHPNSHPNPSEADKVACEESGVPWHIVSPHLNSWGYCEPAGFVLPYVGRKFVFGVVDCYSMCRDWYKREWDLNLTNYLRKDQWWDAGENLYVDNFANEGFKEIPIRELEKGDTILMQIKSPVPNHAAIYLGNQQILQHLQGRLSSRDVYGGYYAINTVMALRHENAESLRGA